MTQDGFVPELPQGAVPPWIFAKQSPYQTLEARVQRGDLLAQAAHALAEAELDLPVRCQRTTELVAAAIGDACVLTLLSPDGEYLEARAYAHRDPRWMPLLHESFRDFRHPRDERIAGRVVRTGQGICESHVDPQQLRAGIHSSYRPYIEQVGVSSLVMVPLKVRGQIIGTLGVTRDRSGQPYTHEDQHLLQELADRAVLAIDNARLYEGERQARQAAEVAEQRFALLARASRRFLEAGRDVQTVLDTVAQTLASEVGDLCSIRLLTNQGQTLQAVAVAHHDIGRAATAGELILGHSKPSNEGLTGRVAQTEASVIVAEVPASDLEPPMMRAISAYTDQFGISSLLIVPLSLARQVIGTLLLARDAPGRPFGPADQLLLEELADRAALIIHNARLYEQAQQAMRLRDLVLAQVSHDLKNPLTRVSLHAQMADLQLQEVLPEVPEPVTRELQGVRDDVNRMTALIDELLEVAQFREGAWLPLERVATDLVELVRRLVHSQQSMTDRHTIRLDTTHPAVVGYWDPTRLARITDNLLSNAVKYSPAGGGIEVRIEADEAGAVLTVQDHGIGIPAADLPHIFTRFHRGSNVVGAIAGTGLGLAGAQELARQHGGTIVVTSQEGLGTTVQVSLPRSSEAVSVTATAAPSAAAAQAVSMPRADARPA